jgi:N4-(beta-N-acetylglucosaminyl)-L-asparaginase
MSPKDAGLDVLERIQANTIEKRLLDRTGKPNFSINFYVVNARGEHAGVAMYGGEGARVASYAVCDENGPRTVACEALFPGVPVPSP